MGFRESLDIACRSRKTHGFDKKDCIGRGNGGSRKFSFGKKRDGNGGRRKEIRARSARRREFMFRTHGNLWAANWRGGIGIEVKRWETEMERGARGQGCMPRATFRINSRIKWPAARHPYDPRGGQVGRRKTAIS